VALLFPGVDLMRDTAALTGNILAMVPAEQHALVLQQLEPIGEWLPLLLFGQLLINAPLAGLTINAIAAFGEELGWRGFMQRYLPGWGFWRGNAVIGVIWGLWHAPLILRGHNYPEHPHWGVAMMVGFCLLLSPLLAHVRERSDSLYTTAVAHGMLNATGGVMVFVAGAGDLLRGPAGFAGWIVLALANLLVWWARRVKAAT
jgi:membrane protease YdiL (CAAX protease family)